MMKALVGLGSNLQEPVFQLRKALKKLESADAIEILRTSSFYRTPPWGDLKQDDFINAVTEIETTLEPVQLMRALQSIEKSMGRRRGARRWGPRLIDLDLLLYGERVCQSRELELPHPRLHERAFVLMPLRELDASLQIPALGSVEKLLQQVDCSGILRLDSRQQNQHVEACQKTTR